MCAASSHPSTSPWPPPARQKVLKPSDWRRRSSRRERATASPAPGSDWTAHEMDQEAYKNLPKYTDPPEGWACACSPVTSPWWFCPRINENTKHGAVCALFSSFVPSAVFRALVLPFLHIPSPPHICGCFPRPPPKVGTSHVVPTCDLKAEVSAGERAWPPPEISAQWDGRASTHRLLHLLWLPPPIFPGGISCPGRQGFYHREYSWTRCCLPWQTVDKFPGVSAVVDCGQNFSQNLPQSTGRLLRKMEAFGSKCLTQSKSSSKGPVPLHL